jgi:hypothetical protein
VTLNLTRSLRIRENHRYESMKSEKFDSKNSSTIRKYVGDTISGKYWNTSNVKMKSYRSGIEYRSWSISTTRPLSYKYSNSANRLFIYMLSCWQQYFLSVFLIIWIPFSYSLTVTSAIAQQMVTYPARGMNPRLSINILIWRLKFHLLKLHFWT